MNATTNYQYTLARSGEGIIFLALRVHDFCHMMSTSGMVIKIRKILAKATNILGYTVGLITCLDSISTCQNMGSRGFTAIHKGDLYVSPDSFDFEKVPLHVFVKGRRAAAQDVLLHGGVFLTWRAPSKNKYRPGTKWM